MDLDGILKKARRHLREAHIESATLDVRLLAMYYFSLSAEDMIVGARSEPSEREIERFWQAVEQRGAGKPVSKIIGQKEFYGRLFYTTEHVLDPRPDTEVLIDAVLKNLPVRKSVSILDLGTGTGCIALTLLAELPRASAVAVDISPDALAVAQKNAKALGVEDRLTMLESQWYDAVPPQKFDIIVSNPPYIETGDVELLAPDVRDYDPILALDGGKDGLDGYHAILKGAKSYCSPQAQIFLEIGYTQKADLQRLAEIYGFAWRGCYQDLAGHDRIVHLSTGKS